MVFHRLWRLCTRLAVIGILLAMAGNVLANGVPSRRTTGKQPQPPANQPGQPAAFVLRRDVAQEQSRIIIPRKFLPSRFIARAANQPLSDAAPPNSSWDGARQKAVNAGLLLATVMAGGGMTVVFVRRRKAGPAIGMLVCTLLLTAALGTAMAIEPSAATVDGGNLLDNAQVVAAVSSQVAVEVVETGDEIILILGKDAPQPPAESVETPAASPVTPDPPAPRFHKGNAPNDD
jgi:hypothetical protein